MRRVREELARQSIVEHDAEVVDALSGSARILAFGDGDVIIEQDGSDTHINFILAGAVAIDVSGREVARRTAGTHVGELALIDPSARRSATVRAIAPTVVARVDEGDFVAIADRRPHVWRALAREVGARLRERGQLVRARNPEPHLFLGCSVEGLPIAREIQSALGHEKIVTQVWTDGVFHASRHATEDLLAVAEAQDFAALVATADDVTTSRHAEHPAPRDNVVFELGMFMGALGRERTVLVLPRDADLKIPSDFLGLKPLDYAQGDPSTLASRLGPVAHSIRRLVMDLGPR